MKKNSENAQLEKGSPAQQHYPLKSRFFGGAKNGLRRSMWIIALVFVWLVFNRFELLDRNLLQSSLLVLAVVLYILALPLSAIFRLDNVTSSWALENRQDVAVVIALAAVVINFSLLGGLLGLKNRGRKVKRKDKRRSAGPIIVRQGGPTRTTKPSIDKG